jgi:hypothetical protein
MPETISPTPKTRPENNAVIAMIDAAVRVFMAYSSKSRQVA